MGGGGQKGPSGRAEILPTVRRKGSIRPTDTSHLTLPGIISGDVGSHAGSNSVRAPRTVCRCLCTSASIRETHEDIFAGKGSPCGHGPAVKAWACRVKFALHNLKQRVALRAACVNGMVLRTRKSVTWEWQK
jgi:hypothetical protein